MTRLQVSRNGSLALEYFYICIDGDINAVMKAEGFAKPTNGTTAPLLRTVKEARRPDPPDGDMVAFFIKRLKLWTGLTKAREVRGHRVRSHILKAAMVTARASHAVEPPAPRPPNL